MSDLYLQHHGIKGQKWGVRKYQNADGTYTAAGKARYGFGDNGSSVGKKKGLGYDSDKKQFAAYGLAGLAIKKYKDKKDPSRVNAAKERESVNKESRDRLKKAKAEYKDAKKQYSKDFNNFYNKSMAAYSPFEKHRHNNEVRYAKALVSAGNKAVKKAQYLEAKGAVKNNPKLVAKGKYKATQAKITNTYYKNILADMESGSSWEQANANRSSQRKSAVTRQKNNRKAYREAKKG